jgi:c-di-GMP-binding flagellar brake protein YcgR
MREQATHMCPVIPPQSDRRDTPRVAIELPVTLTRIHGRPVRGQTLDLSTSGVRVSTWRPLRVDETLELRIRLGREGPALHARVRVLREHASSTFALRFEDLPPDGDIEIQRFLEQRKAAPAKEEMDG